MKTIKYLGMLLAMLALSVSFVSCGDDDDEDLEEVVVDGSNDDDDSEGGVADGGVPSNLINKTLVMTRNNETYLSVTHYKDGLVVNSHTIDYEKYPPKYKYEKLSKTTAKYQLEVTKKTYIPYYGTENYSNFKFDYTLTVNPYSSSGTFSGYETNAYGEVKYKTGTFEIQ